MPRSDLLGTLAFGQLFASGEALVTAVLRGTLQNVRHVRGKRIVELGKRTVRPKPELMRKE